ncbi:MAG: sulfatase [Rikenellaceae bacterium]
MIKYTPLYFCALAATGCSAVEEKPNILFVFVDDLGYADVGFNGSTFYETPNIDAMASQSVVFENSYTYPTSSPSRTALLTGQQSFRTGVYTVPVLEKGDCNSSIFSRWTVTKDYPYYSEQLAEEGYRNIHIGKWHLVGPYPDQELAMEYPLTERLTQPDPWDYSWAERHKEDEIKMNFYPEGRGFEKNVGGTYRGDPALEVGGYQSATGGYHAPFSNPFIEQKADDEWLTDRLTDEAIEFMDASGDDPFFVNLHYYTVHAPFIKRSEELYEKYMAKEGDPILGQGMEKGERRKSVAAYATMIESLDDNFARLVEYLDESGKLDNTIIVFSSDNGYNIGANNKMRGKKRFIYEGGVRVPTFIYWKDKVVARRSQMPISLLDYFPTFIDFAGIEGYDGTLDGTSIRPLLTSDCQETYAERPIYWQLSSECVHGTCTAMRQGDYKLIEFLATGEVELYNLEQDPKESCNIAESEVEVAQRMLHQMHQWRADNDVELPPNAVVNNN